MSPSAPQELARFLIEPRFRRAHVWRPSNPTGLVKDGVTLTDLLTGDVRRCETRRAAAGVGQRILDDEAALDWERIAGWRAWWAGRSTSGIIEINAVGGDGIHLTKLCVVRRSEDAGDVGTRATITRWLERVGHPQLSEFSAK